MKLVKSLALGFLALATVASTQAASVKVTGSSAFRKALYAAAINQTGGSGVSQASFIGADLPSANQAIFIGNGNTIQVCIAGSVGGINWVENGLNVATVAPFDSSYTAKTATAWLDSSNPTAAANIGAAPGYALTGGAAATPSYEVARTADLTLSDSLVESTPYTAKKANLKKVSAGNLGVVQFVFAKGKSDLIGASDANLTNISFIQFQNLANAGYVQLSQFTGDTTNDNSKYVVLVGRDNDSGTRLAAMFESGLFDVNTPTFQYRGLDSGSIDVGSANGTSNKVISSFVYAGSPVSGYSSGGHVKNILNASLDSALTIQKSDLTTFAAPAIAVGYVSLGDAPASAQWLKFNGVAQSTVATQEGQYSFWAYEQAYYRTKAITVGATTYPAVTGAQLTLVNALGTDIANTYATAAGGLLVSSMHASRAGEGLPVYRL